MPKSKLINVGVLGCASIAERFVIPAFGELEMLYHLEGVASRNIEKAIKFSEKFSCKAYQSYDDLVKSDCIDLVYIPLPNSMHYEWIKTSLGNDKHVLVEKSMACSLKEVIELNELAKGKNLVLFENFQFRFHSQLKLIKDLIANNTIGAVRNVKSSFGFPPFPDKNNIRYKKELGGGALLDAGAYPLRVAQEILGFDLYVDSASLEYNEQLGVDIWGAVQLKSQSSNITFQAAFGFDNFYQCNLEVWGNKGMIIARRIFTSPPGQKASVKLVNKDGEQEIHTEEDNHFINLLIALFDLVRHKTTLNFEYVANVNQARLIQEVLVKSHD